jgi:ribosomal protein S18 acetylase RimI-like enzyme
MISVERLTPEDWRTWRDLRLFALREAPYAFSATLADWQGDGDTEERWRNRLTAVPFNVVAFLDGAPAGMVSGMPRSSDGAVELISMYVAPFARGTGAGDALVEAVIEWAAAQGATRVTLAVRETNALAVALYRRHGFLDAESGDPGERIMVRAIEGRFGHDMA